MEREYLKGNNVNIISLEDLIVNRSEAINSYKRWIIESEKDLEILKGLNQPNSDDFLNSIKDYVSAEVFDEVGYVGRSDQRTEVKHKVAKITINEGLYLDEGQIEAVKYLYSLRGVDRFIIVGRFIDKQF